MTPGPTAGLGPTLASERRASLLLSRHWLKQTLIPESASDASEPAS